jgi:WD40 repeat protein
MSRLNSKCTIWILLVVLFSVGVTQLPLATAHGNFSGKLVYTAEVYNTSKNAIMFSITVGGDPKIGRFPIAGGTDGSTSYPRPTKDGQAILCHAFADLDGDGIIDQDKEAPFIAVVNADATDATPLTPPGQNAAYTANFSPDERSVVFAFADTDTDGDGRKTIHDSAHLAVKELGRVDPLNSTASQMASDSLIKILTNGRDFSVEKPAYLTNDLVYFTGKDSTTGRTTVYMYDLRNGDLTPVAPLDTQTRNPAGSKDGTRIAVEVITLTEDYVAIYDVQSKTWSRVSSPGLTASSPTWSVNGTLALSISDSSGWQIMLLDGTGLHKLVEIQHEISAITFSPDGKALAYLWDTDGLHHNVLTVATLDGGYTTTMTPEDSRVQDYDWIPIFVD